MDLNPRQHPAGHSRPSPGPGRRSARKVAALAGAAMSCSFVFAGMASSQAAPASARSASATPGKWTLLGLAQTGAPAMWRGPDHRDWVVFSSNKNGIYQLAMISAAGSLTAKPTTIIKGWSGVSATPSLLANGKSPLLVFAGQDSVIGPLSDGCVVGALPASPQWAIQTWSLSNNCAFSNVGFGDASESHTGELSAAWAGGSGVEYRLGKSGTIPATGPDQQIKFTLSDADSVAEVTDWSKAGHTYAAFDRFFSKDASKDGVYAKDLTANGPVLKAPSSGTESVIYPAQPQRVAMASPSAHKGGIYLAYCSKAGTCSTFLLWKVGAKKTLTVPHTKLALGLAMSQGPSGRLWLAWYDEQNNRVYTVRTNQADTRFGPLESYPAPCIEDGNTHLALTSGSYGRVDVGLECLSAKQVKPTVFITQSQAGLSISASPGKITNTHATTVTFTVTDAGDRVAGAKVKVNGKTLHTSKNGTVTVTFASHSRPGSYRATASSPNYFSGSTTVRVSS